MNIKIWNLRKFTKKYNYDTSLNYGNYTNIFKGMVAGIRGHLFEVYIHNTIPNIKTLSCKLLSTSIDRSYFSEYDPISNNLNLNLFPMTTKYFYSLDELKEMQSSRLKEIKEPRYYVPIAKNFGTLDALTKYPYWIAFQSTVAPSHSINRKNLHKLLNLMEKDYYLLLIFVVPKDMESNWTIAQKYEGVHGQELINGDVILQERVIQLVTSIDFPINL